MAPPSRARPAAVATQPPRTTAPSAAVRLPGDATFRQGRKPGNLHSRRAVVLAGAGGTQHDGPSARPRASWRGRKPDMARNRGKVVLADASHTQGDATFTEADMHIDYTHAPEGEEPPADMIARAEERNAIVIWLHDHGWQGWRVIEPRDEDYGASY